jgi:Ala-tRNA(Pro) deacylase
MKPDILNRIRNFLAAENISYSEMEHEPTRTSEESAAARGESMSIGAKALLLKTDDVFRLFVLPADRQLHSAAIRHRLGVKRTRFARRDELEALTGLVPGCVPPFGEPILPFELYADDLVGAEANKVAFNAGSLRHSILMSASDWERIAKPVRFSFSKL